MVSPQPEHTLEPFEHLPFPEQVRVAVHRLAPLPRELVGREVLLGYLTTPLTTQKVRAAFGGGEFRLSYVEPGKRNPTTWYEVIIDGEPERLELEDYLPSSSRNKKRHDDENERAPAWARQLNARLARLEARGEGEGRLAEFRELFMLAKELGGGDHREDWRTGYKQGIEDGKEAASGAEPKSIGDAVSEAIPVLADALARRQPVARRALPGPRPAAPVPPAAPLPPGAVEVQPATGGNGHAGTPPPKQQMPAWMPLLAREIARGQTEPDDIAFTAAFVLRYAPKELAEGISTALPSVVIEEIKRLEPLVQRFSGKPLDLDYVNKLVTELQTEDPDGDDDDDENEEEQADLAEFEESEETSEARA